MNEKQKINYEKERKVKNTLRKGKQGIINEKEDKITKEISRNKIEVKEKKKMNRRGRESICMEIKKK